MPFLNVEYSPELAEAFDRQGFARAVHDTVPPIVDSSAAAFKTRFRRIEESYFGGGEPDIAAVFVVVSLLSGRTPETKAELSGAVLELARKHVADLPGIKIHIFCEVRDMDRDCYRAHKG